MNIILPKTLAEPLTIPWFVNPLDKELHERIKDTLTQFFKTSEDKYKAIGETQVINGRLHLSVASLIRFLRREAERLGAYDVNLTYKKVKVHNERHIGNTYWMSFRLPNDDFKHQWGAVSWFDEMEDG